jgi:Rrf2 family protein
MIHMSEAASLALHSMVLLAQAGNEKSSTKEIAHRTGVSQAHLAKVLQRLSKAGLVDAVRGPGGGYFLAKTPSEITLAQVYEAISGPLSESKCLLQEGACPFRQCLFDGLLEKVTAEISDYLTRRTLHDLLE